MSRPLLQFPTIRAAHLEGHLYTYVQQYCAEHNISIEINRIEIQKPPRQGDKCIMDVACSDLEISDADCRKIYYCKSYLQVKWLSDLLSADKKFIPKGIFHGYQMIDRTIELEVRRSCLGKAKRRNVGGMEKVLNIRALQHLRIISNAP